MRAAEDFVGGDLVPISFQVAEQLHRELQAVRNVVLSHERVEGHAQGTPDIFEYLPNDIASRINDIEPDVKHLLKVEKLRKQRGKIKKFYELSIRPGFISEFSTVTKMYLVDEAPHAENILRRIHEYGVEFYRWSHPRKKKAVSWHDAQNELGLRQSTDVEVRNLRRDIKGIRELPERYKTLDLFSTQSFLALERKTREAIKSNRLKDLRGAQSWENLLKTLQNELKKNIQKPSGPRFAGDAGRKLPTVRTFVAPSHRFVLEMLAVLHSEPWNLLISAKKQLTRTETKSSEEQLEKFKSRTSIIDADLDPLAKLVERLDIRRFLTLNYDFEIERLFQDRGFRRFAIQDDLATRLDRPDSGLLDEDYRVDGIGSVLRDASFRRERATDLLSFSFDNTRSDAEVYHLHGQAADDSPLVITERDYMDLYLRNDRYREVVNEAIESAFSANPLLFVGLGLKESDVLRPLRQFMSDQAGASSRMAIALFPADKNEAARARDSAGLYLRYGVHTVYYGSGTVQVDLKGRAFEQPIDWLHRISELISVLRGINEEWLKPLERLAEGLSLIPKLEKEADDVAKERWEDFKKFAQLASSECDRPTKNPFHKNNTEKFLLERIKDAVGRRTVQFDAKHHDDEVTGAKKTQEFDVLSILFGQLKELENLEDFMESDSAGSYMGVAPCRFLIPRADAVTREVKKRQQDGRGNYLVFERELLAHILRTTLETTHQSEVAPKPAFFKTSGLADGSLFERYRSSGKNRKLVTNLNQF